MRAGSDWEAKIARAREHVATLHDEIEQCRSSGALGISTEREGSDWIVRLVMPDDPPARWGTIVGDVLHNARSSLDCLALAVCAAAAGRGLSADEEQQVQFPIAHNSGQFKTDCKARLPHASANPTIVDRFRRCQPFFLPDQARISPDRRAEAIQHDPLAALHRLSILDKHRRLHLVAWVPTDISAGSPDGVKVGWRWAPRPWAHGSEIGRWVVHDANAEVELSTHGSVDLILQEHLDLGWVNVTAVGCLRHLVDHVAQVVVPSVERVL